MTDIPLQRRSLPGRLRYLAAKLRENPSPYSREAAAIALEVTADEMDARPKSQPAYIQALAEATDDDLREALIHIGPAKRARLRELLTGKETTP